MDSDTLATVLCPKCVRPGGLRLNVEVIGRLDVAKEVRLRMRDIPVLYCILPLCRYVALGYVDEGTGDAVFPDPHVQAERNKREN